MKNWIISNWNKLLTGILAIFILFNEFIKASWHIIDKYLHGHSAIATILGSLITLLGTVGAMIFVQHQNKKMWEKEGLQKYKNDTLINLIKYLRTSSINSMIIKDICKGKCLWEYKPEFIEEYIKCFDFCSSLKIFEQENSQRYKDLDTIQENLQVVLKIFTYIDKIRNNSYGLLKEFISREEISFVIVTNERGEGYENFDTIDINKIGSSNFRLSIEFEGLIANFATNYPSLNFSFLDFDNAITFLKDKSDAFADILVNECRSL